MDSSLHATASLLDRLVDLDPKAKREARPFRVQSADELKNSILRDLGWLLSTRTPRKREELDWDNRTVIDYGIPDFADYHTANPEDWRKIAQLVQQTISVYEPRLAQVKVKILPSEHEIKSLQLRIEAAMRIEDREIPVAFPVLISGRGESALVTVGRPE